MKILSHRGYWTDQSEKNKEPAFSRSFTLGFGTETDIRDYRGALVISHDIPCGDEIHLQNFLEMIISYENSAQLTLALNIKADGLAERVAQAIACIPKLDCFAFDMAVPDMLSYFDVGIPVFTRMSEVERVPVWLDRSAGVWLDGFESEWYGPDLILDILKEGKRVCLVSPELHTRPHGGLWRKISGLSRHSDIMLCTDFPVEARHYFHLEEPL